MVDKKNILVLFGGKADEHSISCISASGVLNAMDTEKFNPIPVGITKEGQWVLGGEDPRVWSLDAAKKSGKMPEVKPTENSLGVILDPSSEGNGFLTVDMNGMMKSIGHIDAVFPVLHGPYGEDGTVQGLLEMMNVPYVGCGVLASAACMDKHYTKEILCEAGIPVAQGFTIDARHEEQTDGVWLLQRVQDEELEYPLYVKPSRAGSSYGVTRVDRADSNQQQCAALEAAVREASEHDWRILIEQGVNGREIECAVLAPRQGELPRTSLPGEIVIDAHNTTDFYDFDSKYMDDQASHVEVPAALPEEILKKVVVGNSLVFISPTKKVHNRN
ncbi:MAG: D-alanine--D-alanine ligase [Sphaerochaetaceae bacterium]|nr:D-alanine--D-alanine ligase [Sphaerochaetaceae bacterium]